MRGIVTVEIKNKAFELLGIEDLSTTEFRLMPYIQYVMMNEQKIDLRRINQEDREVLSCWRKKEWITGGASEMTITKEFWGAINELLWMGYVDV